MKPSANETIAVLQTVDTVYCLLDRHPSVAHSSHYIQCHGICITTPNMDFLTMTKYTVKMVICVSVDIVFEKLVMPMNTHFHPHVITLAKMAVKLSFELLIETLFQSIMRQVQARMEDRLGGDRLGEGVDEADGLV